MEAVLGEAVRAEVDFSVLSKREFGERLPGYTRLAFRVALGILHHREEAEDVAQEALLRAHRDFASLRNPERFEAWLVRVTWRMAIDRQRSMRRRERRESQIVPESFPTAEQLAASTEFEEALFSAMDQLPEKLRVVIVLAGIQGYGAAEVARLLGVPEGTVKSRLHAARKKLADKLRKFGT